MARGGILLGEVTNKSDGETLLGVTVILSGDSEISAEFKTTVSNRNGRYEILDIPPGDYNLTFSLIGFETVNITGITLSESDTLILNAELIHGTVIVDTILVTASRQPEKIFEAPASVSVIGSKEIEARTTLTPSEHVKNQPAVDFATTGLNQSNVVVRGFNNIFSGALLVLNDNRIARIPSLRYNAYNFIPLINQDIERIEVVSGPGSALYGPNSADGIMHIISKSPFSSQGTTVSLGGGQRDLYFGAFRHAGNVKNRVGFKISGQYYKGKDWESFDPYEPDSIRLFRPTATGPVYEGSWKRNHRNFDIEKISGETRGDFLVNKDLLLIVNGGLNRSSGIELTSLGAGQAINWIYAYGQARMVYKDLFIQGYVNLSDAGDTYLLRTGQQIVDKSKVYVGQIQHQAKPTERLSFIYGMDAILTRPNTLSTINGRNEESDNINEFGVYLQSRAEITERLRFIGAARIDDHSRIEDLIFSPRAGLTYHPNHNNNLRITFNRAYATPNNANLFLDILQAKDPFGIGAAFESELGFRPDIDVRAQGVPETGFHWRINENGPSFRSSFAPLDPRDMQADDYIDFNDPTFTNVMWRVGRETVINGFIDILADMGIPQQTIDSLSVSLQTLTPITISGVDNTLKIYNPDTRSFDHFDPDNLVDIERLKPSYTNTLEFGYKGVAGERLRFGIDVYRTERNNFVGPLAIETPNVFLDRETLSTYLDQEFTALLNDPDNDNYAAFLDSLDEPSLGGNGNGTAVDELTNIFSYGAAQIPFGTVSPEEALNPEAVLITFRNFGAITIYGLDLNFALRLNGRWSCGGNYSYISKNLFRKSDTQVHDIYLNAPKHKFGINLQYANPGLGLGAQVRLRFIDGFEMYGPFVGTTVESYTVIDLNLGLGLSKNSLLSLTVQNLLDNRHIEFVGAPEIGRLAMLRFKYSF